MLDSGFWILDSFCPAIPDAGYRFPATPSMHGGKEAEKQGLKSTLLVAGNLMLATAAVSRITAIPLWNPNRCTAIYRLIS
jgi:hypothetical protein